MIGCSEDNLYNRVNLMAKRILIMGSFDTKASELTFLRERVTELGFEAVCMDTSHGSCEHGQGGDRLRRSFHRRGSSGQ